MLSRWNSSYDSWKTRSDMDEYQDEPRDDTWERYKSGLCNECFFWRNYPIKLHMRWCSKGNCQCKCRKELKENDHV